MTPLAGFALASALHAGFQLVVTVLVYPALASRPAEEWTGAHARHSRGITPLVVLVYATLVVTGTLLVLDAPGRLGWAALALGGVALVLTAVGAAPLHGRLAQHDPAALRRLLVVDRARCVAAVAGALASVVALLGA